MYTLFEGLRSIIFPSYNNKRKFSETDILKDISKPIDFRNQHSDDYVYKDTLPKIPNFKSKKPRMDEMFLQDRSHSLENDVIDMPCEGDSPSSEITVSSIHTDYHLRNFRSSQNKAQRFLNENYLDNLVKPSHTDEMRRKRLEELSMKSNINKTKLKKCEKSYMEDLADRFHEICSFPPLIFARRIRKPALPKITEEMLEIIEDCLGMSDNSEIIVRAFNLEVQVLDVKSLKPREWLTDNVINFYLELIYNRSHNNSNLPKVQILSSFFYPKLLKSGYNSVKRWTKRRPIFNDYSLLLIPIHLGNHWCFVKVDFDNQEVLYYDSLKSRDVICLKTIQEFLKQDSLDKLKQNFPVSDWSFKQIFDGPSQLNSYDCGVFLCQTAEYLSRKVELSFTQDQMPYFRQKMSYEILSQNLL